MRGIKVRSAERGSAMVISLLVLLVLTMVGTMFLVQTKTETQISGHDMRSTQALYNAEAGYAEVLARMADMRDTTNYIGQATGAWTTDPGWGEYVVAANGDAALDPDYAASETDGLDNDGDGQVDEGGERYPEIASKQTGSDAIGYDWVKVRYKLNATSQVVLFGDHDSDLSTPPRMNLTRGYPVIVVTSHGDQGSANRTVEVEAVKYPFETVDAAIYTEDDNFQFNGTQFLVSGKDWDPETGAEIPGNPEVPGISTTKDPSNISGSLNAQQQNNVEGSGTDPSVTTSTVDLDLQAMADQYSTLATVILPSGTYSNQSWGDYDNYVVAYCQGDMATSGQCSGAGLLIVNGNFDCAGTFIWYGAVLVLGDINFTGGGYGIHIFGTVMCQGGITEQVVGGNADVKYSSAALARLAMLTPYVVSSWHEL
jgi:hypothetical protein